MHRLTIEEKAARKIVRELSDFHLDLEALGYYLSRFAPYTIFRRAIEVLESMQYQQEQLEQREMQERHDRLF